VPPYFRVVDESTWLNALKSLFNRSEGMPIPVSRIANSRRKRFPSAGAPRFTSTETLPKEVNFTALFTRLVITCQSRVTSPEIHGGTSRAML